MCKERTVVEFAAAGCNHGIIEGLKEAGDGEVEVVGLGGLDGVIEVLELELGGAAGFEVALDHAEPVFGKDTAGGKAALEGLADFGGVGPTGTSEDESFRNSADGDGDDDLVGEFGELAAAVGADMGRAAHGIKDGDVGLVGFLIAADHDGKFAFGGTDGSAGDRGLETGMA